MGVLHRARRLRAFRDFAFPSFEMTQEASREVLNLAKRLRAFRDFAFPSFERTQEGSQEVLNRARRVRVLRAFGTDGEESLALTIDLTVAWVGTKWNVAQLSYPLCR